MKLAGNAIVLLILIVAIAAVAAPLLSGDGAPSASAAASAARPAGVLRVVPSHTTAAAVQADGRVGEWAMLLVGSALIVVGAVLRRRDARVDGIGDGTRGPRPIETSIPGRE